LLNIIGQDGHDALAHQSEIVNLNISNKIKPKEKTKDVKHTSKGLKCKKACKVLLFNLKYLEN